MIKLASAVTLAIYLVIAEVAAGESVIIFNSIIIEQHPTRFSVVCQFAPQIMPAAVVIRLDLPYPALGNIRYLLCFW